MAQDIPVDDLVALRLYLKDYRRDVDAALRALDHDRLDHFDALIRVATHALYQLPPYRGPVFRGAFVSEELIDLYVPGHVILERAFFSGSADPARMFPGNVQYVIHSVNGRLVRALTDNPEELEVMFFTQTRFKVLAVDIDRERGERIVYLDEIPDPRLYPSAAS